MKGEATLKERDDLPSVNKKKKETKTEKCLPG